MASSALSNLMLAIHEKKTSTLDLYRPLRNYSERSAQLIEDDLETLKQLRSDVERVPDLSPSARRDLLISYYKALCLDSGGEITASKRTNSIVLWREREKRRPKQLGCDGGVVGAVFPSFSSPPVESLLRQMQLGCDGVFVGSGIFRRDGFPNRVNRIDVAAAGRSLMKRTGLRLRGSMWFQTINLSEKKPIKGKISDDQSPCYDYVVVDLVKLAGRMLDECADMLQEEDFNHQSVFDSHGYHNGGLRRRVSEH
ncbi:hypothetical protein F2Q70_00027662 [Brassica cretica]|uniref:Uncharacterized protein n=1 Tax=Brassica cretica TaxID=69181 RepID=A0A8S9LEK1_BRACR|nr:hypothetical protein F2Q70_00027662 [Brassica cretica]